MPRKAISKKQFRLFKAVESGEVKLPGLDPTKAVEMTASQSPVGLPERYRSTPQRKRSWRFQ